MRNAESRFALNPVNLDIPRSKFSINRDHKTTFNVGELIPFFFTECLPGDTHQIKTSKVIRLQTLLTPMMDNLYLDCYYFYTPNRLLMDHWPEFLGENTQSAWIPETEYTIPQMIAPEGGWNRGTIADYLGLPIKKQMSVSALPFRCYALICNEWFRDENLMDPLNLYTGDSNLTGSNGINQITDVPLGGRPFIACKFHDYFTSALPAPQKGPDVKAPFSGQIPVYTSFLDNPGLGSEERAPLRWLPAALGQSVMPAGDFVPHVYRDSTAPMDSSVTFYGGAQTGTPQDREIYPSNLVVNGGEFGFTINALRYAFSVQRFLEKNARGGTRMIELIKAHFGVTSADARQQRPQYLGGNRIPINISQVIQQSATDVNSPQGNVTAMSLTTDVNHDAIISTTEHGYIMGVMVARYDHSYQQGIERSWSRKTKLDYYWPSFANIGEQAIKLKELYATGTVLDENIFGYQEAWAEYRYGKNLITGEMRSDIDGMSLDSWHLGDYYGSRPFLSADWIRENKDNVDRVLSIGSSVANQLFADIYVQDIATRPMPMYSIPGLIDHH